MDEARQEAALFMSSNPHFSVLGGRRPTRPDAATLQHFVEGYSKAGLAGLGQALRANDGTHAWQIAATCR